MMSSSHILAHNFEAFLIVAQWQFSIIESSESFLLHYNMAL